MGNEALVRGAYEAGLDYASCYPGTPSSEVSNLLYELQGAGGFRMDFATNEKVAMEAVAGASMGGLNCLTAMKHVGLNVASDPLGTLTYLGVRGSLVVYSADDPSMFSSQNEQDNRQYARLFGLPCFEPATAQEMKDMTVAAFALSAQMGMPVMVRATTRVAHSRGVVELGDIRPKAGRAAMKRITRSCRCRQCRAPSQASGRAYAQPGSGERRQPVQPCGRPGGCALRRGRQQCRGQLCA